MPNTTKEDKALVERFLHAYIHNGSQMSVKQYERLTRWLNGETFVFIAQREGVSKQAVAKSIRQEFLNIKAFALKELKR